MAGKYTRLQLTYKLEDSALPMYTGVTYGAAEGGCKIPTTDGAYPLGVVDSDERVDTDFRAGGDQTGRDIAVKIECIADIKLSGAVSYGQEVILEATTGKAKLLPTAIGEYWVLGRAEKTGVDGDVIPVRIERRNVKITA